MKCDNCNEDMVLVSTVDETTGIIIKLYTCFHCGNRKVTDKTE